MAEAEAEAEDDGASTDSSQRQDISARLHNFFSPNTNTPSAAVSPSSSSAMRPARTSFAAAVLPQRAIQSSSSSRSPRPTLMNLSMPPANNSATDKHSRPSQSTLPILRWFSSDKPGLSSPGQSRPPTPSPGRSGPSSPSTPSSALSILADAFGDDPHIQQAHSHTNSEDVKLPSRPEAARLSSTTGFHRPSYFSNLTRSTMPTACLSPPHPSSYVRNMCPDPFEDPFIPQPDHDSSDLDMFLSPTPVPLPMPHSPERAHMHSSPPAGSSIDSLRSIHARSRSIHTSSPSQGFGFPQLPSLKTWFSSEEPADKHDNPNPMLSEEDQGETAEAERDNIRAKYVATKNPLVFCHGLLGFDTVTLGPAIAPLQVQHWRGIRNALEANGIEVLTTRVPATSSPVDRAKVLCEKIAEVYPGRAVHLIGHSMGGIDCRYLTTHLTDRPFKVLSVTTISAPHRGSSFADQFLQTVGRERLPSVLSLIDLLPNGGGDGKAFEFLTVENMCKFNENTPDVPGVHYFSWGAVYEPGLIDTWKWPHSVVLEKEGPNDGLVSLKSAQWGTYLGTLEGVNHLDLVGWINTARYKWAEIMGRGIKFKPATFYLGIADHLARVVEGQEPGIGHETAGTGAAEVEGGERRPGPSRETSDVQRAEMAESLEKGRSQGEAPARGTSSSTDKKMDAGSVPRRR